MSIRHAYSVIGAAVLSCAAVAFAHTPDSIPAGTVSVSHHDSDSNQASVSLVGCIQRERDYREQRDLGRGGFIGTGGGVGNEFVMINAAPASPADVSHPNEPDCTTVPSTGRAYELKGGLEKDIEPFVGRRIEITGWIDPAKADLTVGTSGEVVATEATGGSRIGRDLKLFELEVESFRELPAATPRPVAAAPPPEPAPTPAPPPAVEEKEEVVIAETPAAPELPKTASPLALSGLLGLLSLAGAFGLRTWRQ